MSFFKPLNVHKYQKTGIISTPDVEYWKRLQAPTIIKEFGAIDYIDFSPVEPHYFAVTCSVRVQIYNPITKLLAKNLSRFQDTAYGGTFREDGRLLVAGDAQALVKLFDTSSKNVLRLFKGHKAAVHRVNFTTDLLQIISYSDDRTVKMWDIASEKTMHTFDAHTDYVRAGAVNPISTNIFISGGYDGKINMYDVRMKEATLSISHGSPVESLLFLPSGGIFMSAGGTDICVWDSLYCCRLLTRLTQHHKTVTCLRLGSNGKRVLSSSLDRNVKIYDVETYQTVHTLTFPNSVLSLGIAPNDHTLVAGMVDGLISVQSMEKNQKKETAPVETKKTRRISSLTNVDHEIRYMTGPKMASYNLCLRKYEYAKCLDIVMTRHIVAQKPEVTVAVMQELMHRKGLQRSLAGRNNEFIAGVIRFICRYIGEHRFMRVLIDVANALLDVYNNKSNVYLRGLGWEFTKLANVIQKEKEFSTELLELQGALEMIMDASTVGRNNEHNVDFFDISRTKPTQSTKAEESSVMII